MNEYSEIICIVDRSGSMDSVRESAIDGFNKFLAEQKSLPGDASLTLLLFNHHQLIVHENVQLTHVSPLTPATYQPDGTTALLDAVGTMIDNTGKRLAAMPEEMRPRKVIVAILTDGMENASERYTYDQIKGMIEHQREKYGWEFLFLAANIDAFAEGDRLGIARDRTVSFEATSEGTQDAFSSISSRVTSWRAQS